MVRVGSYPALDVLQRESPAQPRTRSSRHRAMSVRDAPVTRRTGIVEGEGLTKEMEESESMNLPNVLIVQPLADIMAARALLSIEQRLLKPGGDIWLGPEEGIKVFTPFKPCAGAVHAAEGLLATPGAAATSGAPAEPAAANSPWGQSTFSQLLDRRKREASSFERIFPEAAATTPVGTPMATPGKRANAKAEEGPSSPQVDRFVIHELGGRLIKLEAENKAALEKV